VGQVVDFKRDVYRRALKELAPHLLSHVSERLTVSLPHGELSTAGSAAERGSPLERGSPRES
jgi:hypothetical protein